MKIATYNVNSLNARLPVLLRWLVPESNLQFDYLAIAKILLVTQLLPLGLGMALHERASNLSRRIVKPLSLLGAGLVTHASV